MQPIAAVSLALALAAGAAHAEFPFSHPAVGLIAAQGSVQARAASPVLIGHPASPSWQVVHANHEHPAVLQARLAAGVDANTFIVQPPASVQWTAGPAPEARLALVGR